MISQNGADVDAARAVVQQYICASGSGDVEAIKAVFCPKALMSGYLQGQLGIETPDPFYEAVADNPPSASIAGSYSASITAVEVAGNVHRATLVEKGFLGMDFVDYFHLLKEDGKWTIIAKTFNQG